MVAATLAVIGILAGYVQLYGREDTRAEASAGRSAHSTVSTGPDPAIYNSLYTVKDEIPLIYDDINMFNEPGSEIAGRICRTSKTVVCRRS